MEGDDDNLDMSADLSLFLNITIEEERLTSTPKATRAKKAALPRPTASPFKRPTRPARPIQRGPVLAVCKRCGAEYRTLRFYKKHVQGHALKGKIS